MEFVNSTTSINRLISPAIPFFTWKRRKTPSRPIIPNSRKNHLPLSSSLYLFRPNSSTKFTISAHFSRHSNRQNYLRKKLTQQQQHQQRVSHLQKPIRQFDNDIYESNVDSLGETRNNVEESSPLDGGIKFHNDSSSVEESQMELRENKIGESIMWNKLESWAEQYEKDSEFWGIGSGHIFTVYQNSEGKVEKVVVSKDEILRRQRFDPVLGNYNEDLAEVNYKISFAKDLAKEMEEGGNVIPTNSSVAKFLTVGGESRFVKAIWGVNLKPDLFSRMSRVGVSVMCGLFVVWAVREIFTGGKDRKGYTRLEKEMLRRKMKARAENEEAVKGTVEVIMQEPVGVSLKRPQVDKEELVNSIIKMKGSNGELVTVEHSEYQHEELKDKIENIRAMAREARQVEKGDILANDGDLNEFSREEKEINARDFDQRTESTSSTEELFDGPSVEKSETEFRNIPHFAIPNGTESSRSDLNETNVQSNGPASQSNLLEKSSRKKFRIIKSAQEAKEYLSKKHNKLEMDEKHEVRSSEQTDIGICTPSTNVASVNTGRVLDLTDTVHESSAVSETQDVSDSSEEYSADSITAERNVDSLNSSEKSRISSGHEVSAGQSVPDTKTNQEHNSVNEVTSLGTEPDIASTEDDHGGFIQAKEVPTPLNKHDSENTETHKKSTSHQFNGSATANKVNDRNPAPVVHKESWMERNFHEFGAVVEKIGVGFKDNYHVGKEKASEEYVSESELMEINSDGAEYEFEWMKDEKLSSIVFKVRDNELSGREPFHLMSEEDKSAFFSGLEKMVEKENEKLLKLHEYFHSNIENLDYGAGGISIYDPPEKIMPRWKDPPAEMNPEFLNKSVEQRDSFLSKKTAKNTSQTPDKPSSHDSSPVSTDVSKPNPILKKKTSKSSKTIIEGSDGSVRAGKKSGKEFWQHTKKWSEGFLESYNAETDPEVKAVMRDIGKDLDRWITDKEIKEAAELIDAVPGKREKLLKQKLDKVKREMELYGPQAVVSKYREYADEKEEDYLWWVDLPYVLCIELYTVENGEQRVGFYSLEMAADLELNPKQYHVIAFEDAGDCKNLCYIIQAHMEMLGNGNAFVVARPPKDAFREAKADGFSVTVIRKGQLKLNIDQTLEEVEELMIEIGSKIYHDKITNERSVDIDVLMKGVLGVSKPPRRRRRRSKQKSKRRLKP